MVVGEVEASLSLGELLASGGLDGISESQEQFGEGGCCSYLITVLSVVAKLSASLSEVVSAAQVVSTPHSEPQSLKGYKDPLLSKRFIFQPGLSR